MRAFDKNNVRQASTAIISVEGKVDENSFSAL